MASQGREGEILSGISPSFIPRPFPRHSRARGMLRMAPEQAGGPEEQPTDKAGSGRQSYKDGAEG